MQQATEDFAARAIKLLPNIKAGKKEAVSQFEELCVAQFTTDSPACYRCVPITLETAFNGGTVTTKTFVDDQEKEFTVFVNKAADTLDKVPLEETDSAGKPVVFVVVVEPHKVFKRVGDDLVLERKATNTELLIGTAFSIKGLDGQPVILRTAAMHLIPMDSTYVATGQGMPKRNDVEHRGDLHVHINYSMFSLTSGVLWEVAGLVRTCWNRMYSNSVLLEPEDNRPRTGENEQEQT